MGFGLDKVRWAEDLGCWLQLKSPFKGEGRIRPDESEKKMQWKREGRKGTDKDFEGMWKDVKNQRERETDKLKRTKFKESRKGQKRSNKLIWRRREKKKGTRNYANETWQKREEKKQEKREEKRGTKRKKKPKKKAGERITKIRERKRESSKMEGKVERNKFSWRW